MRIQEIKKTIKDAIADEKRSGRMAEAFTITLQQNGEKATQQAIRGRVRLAREYIEQVPVFLEQGETAAKHLDFAGEIEPLLRELEDYWFEDNDLIPDHPGLRGLLDDAYATLALLQAISDYCAMKFGRPLLEMNLAAANEDVRVLIGEPKISALEQRIVRTLADKAIHRTMIHLAKAKSTVFMEQDGDIRLPLLRRLIFRRGMGSKEKTQPIQHAEPPQDDELGLDSEPSSAAPPLTHNISSMEEITPATSPEFSTPPSETRWLNAEIRDHEANEPLSIGESYLLEFGVDVKAWGDAHKNLPPNSQLFKDGDEFITLNIQLQGSHFDIAQGAQPLKLPRAGPSKGRARFDIVPKEEGQGTLTAIISKDGNYFMQMEITYSLGTGAATVPSPVIQGRTLAAAANLKFRKISLYIKPAPGGEYDCTVVTGGAKPVHLPITETALADAIKIARDGLMSVVSQRNDAAELVFQTGWEVDNASADKALQTLAKAGARLFQKIFYGPLATGDLKQIGELLKTSASEPNAKPTLQIIAERFPVPWGLLYLGDINKNAALCWDNFLGLRYIIEQIPITNNLVDTDVIQSDNPSLAISVNVNRSIDDKWKTRIVERQLEFWNDNTAALGSRLQVAQRERREDFVDALSSNASDQIMYLYCHAVTAGPADAGGISGSCLILTNNERLTLDDLNLEAPISQPLDGHPLVFLNACESAELTPAFYDGFIPYFMAKRARGVIGTECKMPAVFATEWALRFFPRFLKGEALGELFLDLRQEFCQKHNNPLGLLYAVYCSADTQIQPGLTI
jgi:hypothetical protein